MTAAQRKERAKSLAMVEEHIATCERTLAMDDLTIRDRVETNTMLVHRLLRWEELTGKPYTKETRATVYDADTCARRMWKSTKGEM